MAATTLSVDTGSPVETCSGDVTSPQGFRAAGIHCGLKKTKLDLALVLSDRPASAAGLFTQNKVKAAPVLHSRRVIATGSARAILCNSANANACTGDSGLRDAQEMGSLAAEELGLVSSQVVVASTGVIGVPLDMGAIRSGIPRLVADLAPSGETAAKAIMTTDTYPKAAAVRFKVGEKEVVIGGMAKGVGMIQPNMATTLCFLTTDAAMAPALLQATLHQAIEGSFNRVTIDGDTSTNDCAILLANGASGVEIEADSDEYQSFVAALGSITVDLAKMLVRDAEGGTKVITLTVDGAKDDAEALRAAFTIANSPLVKTAFYGGQANWGRVLAAAGRADVEMDESRSDILFNGVAVARGGLPVLENMASAELELRKPEIEVQVSLAAGSGSATVWTSDLTEEYVRINGSYIS